MTLIDPDNSDNFDYLQTTWHYPMDITHIIYTRTYDNPDISYGYCSRDIHSYDNPDNPDNPDTCRLPRERSRLQPFGERLRERRRFSERYKRSSRQCTIFHSKTNKS